MPDKSNAILAACLPDGTQLYANDERAAAILMNHVCPAKGTNAKLCDTTHIVPPPTLRPTARVGSKRIWLDKLVQSTETCSSQALTEAHNSTIQLTAKNAELQKKLTEVLQSHVHTNPCYTSNSSHTSTQTECVVICPRIPGKDAGTQSNTASKHDADTSPAEVLAGIDAQIQVNSCPRSKDGHILGRAVQTEQVGLEACAQTLIPYSKNQSTQSEFESNSIAVQSLTVEVANRGCSAKPEVKDSCMMADIGHTSIDAVWVGKAASSAALQDVKTRFADISRNIYVERITELVFLVIFIACDRYKSISRDALDASHVTRWCSIDKLQRLVRDFPSWAWNPLCDPPSNGAPNAMVSVVSLCSHRLQFSWLFLFLSIWRTHSVSMRRHRDRLGPYFLASSCKRRLLVALGFCRWKILWIFRRWRKIPDMISRGTDTWVDLLPPPLHHHRCDPEF